MTNEGTSVKTVTLSKLGPPLLLWFISSTALSSFNKWIFGYKSFEYPLMLTSLHFLTQWAYCIMAPAASAYFSKSSNVVVDECCDDVEDASAQISPDLPSCFRPAVSRIKALPPDGVAHFPLSTFLIMSVPIGMMSSLDIAFSNLSLSFISISAYVTIKSTAPAFVALFAWFFRLERFSYSLAFVVTAVSLGEAVSAMGGVVKDKTGGDEGASSSPFGLILCLAASVLSGVRWTLVQMLFTYLPKKYRKPTVTVRITAPTMFALTLLVSVALEGPWNVFKEYNFAYVACAAFFGGSIATIMILSEFELVARSSAVVLAIGGVVKELLAVAAGVLAFGDRLDALNIFGLAIVMSGVVVFKLRHLSPAAASADAPPKFFPVAARDEEDEGELTELISSSSGTATREDDRLEDGEDGQF